MENLRVWEGELLQDRRAAWTQLTVHYLSWNSPFPSNLVLKLISQIPTSKSTYSGAILKYFLFTAKSLVSENGQAVWSNRNSHMALEVKNLPARQET